MNSESPLKWSTVDNKAVLSERHVWFWRAIKIHNLSLLKTVKIRDELTLVWILASYQQAICYQGIKDGLCHMICKSV